MRHPRVTDRQRGLCFLHLEKRRGRFRTLRFRRRFTLGAFLRHAGRHGPHEELSSLALSLPRVMGTHRPQGGNNESIQRLKKGKEKPGLLFEIRAASEEGRDGFNVLGRISCILVPVRELRVIGPRSGGTRPPVRRHGRIVCHIRIPRFRGDPAARALLSYSHPHSGAG